MNQLKLRCVHPFLHERATCAFNEGDAGVFVFSCENRLGTVADNLHLLKKKGIFEKCLLTAFKAEKINFHKWPPPVLEELFRFADKVKLREAGDAIPEQPTFQVFRGVAGHGVARRLRGVSWTLSLDVACWFATRFGLAQPAVFAAEIANEAILAYSNERSENEVICYPESPQRVGLSPAEMRERAANHQNQMGAADFPTGVLCCFGQR